MMRKQDQAAGLRRMLARTTMRVLPLVSVLDRSAQALLAVHLAAAYSYLGNRVVIVDASRGDVAAAMNLNPRYELLHLLQGEKEYGDVALDGPDALRLVPAARGIESMEHADDEGWTEFFGAFTGLSEAPDLVLLNCAPGEAHAACRAAGGTHEVVLALDASPESVTAAYSLIKASLQSDGQRRYRLLFADLPGDADAAPLADRMIGAGQRFLGADLRDGGSLPRHVALQSATRQTLVSSDPAHPAAAAFLSLAGASADWGLPEFSRPAAVSAAVH
ncbi:MAG: MinD/ParA family protein [Burkholderiales bacterium]